MTIPTNLFIDTPEMQDVSMHQLSNDSESWPEEIIQKVKERIPQAASLSMMIKFMKKDDENGTATGSIVINSNEKAAVVPVIIKDFAMYPLDVMVAEKKLLPFSPDYFNSIFGSKSDVFTKIEEFPTFGGLGRFEEANLWNAIYPPALGRYAYASAGFPILDAISDSINGAEFKAFLENEEKIAAQLLSGPHKDIIKKLANLRPVNMNEFRQGVENLIRRPISMLRKEGPNKYTLLSSSDQVFHPGFTPMTHSEALEFLSTITDHVDDIMNEVDQNGEKILSSAPSDDPVILGLPEKDIPEMATSYDHYVVKNKRGIAIEGIVIPKVVNFDQEPTDLKTFIGKTMSTIQPDIAGIRVKNSSFTLPKCCPKVGQTGCFVFQPDASHALATIPVVIQTVVEECGDLSLSAMTLLGAPLSIRKKMHQDNTLQRIAKTAPGKYILPKEMFWVPMEGFEEITNSPEDYSVKTAAYTYDMVSTSIIPTGYGMYAVKGLEKYAKAAGFDSTMIKESDLRFLMLALGSDSEKIAATFKTASTIGRAEVRGLKMLPLVGEKIAEMRPVVQYVAKVAANLKSNLIKEASLLSKFPKEAAYLENTQTVDSLLSLNFISPDNIAKFIGKIPQFKATISHLAGCILASRLGMKEIPEQAATSAMQRMMEVVSGLESLRSAQEVSSSKGT